MTLVSIHSPAQKPCVGFSHSILPHQTTSSAGVGFLTVSQFISSSLNSLSHTCTSTQTQTLLDETLPSHCDSISAAAGGWLEHKHYQLQSAPGERGHTATRPAWTSLFVTLSHMSVFGQLAFKCEVIHSVLCVYTLRKGICAVRDAFLSSCSWLSWGANIPEAHRGKQ